MKKFKIMSYIILLIVLVVLALTVYTSATQNNNKDEEEKEKVSSEIKYLDTKLVDLFNNMNNIVTRNYRIYTTKVEESRSAENSGEGGSSSEGEEGSGNSSNSNSDSGSDSGSGNGTSSGDSSGGSSNNTETENTGKSYEMQESGILTSDRNIDWTACKNELELIYTSVSTITLDLYSLNINQDDILNFNKEIDNLTVSIEGEDKQASLDNLVKVYEFMPKFVQNAVSDTLYKTVIDTKLNVFKAYSKLDSEDWDGMSSDITDAINVYTSLLTNAEIEVNKQGSVNKGYVMLNELKNAVDIKNSSVFLIKYKNLLEEINNM